MSTCTYLKFWRFGMIPCDLGLGFVSSILTMGCDTEQDACTGGLGFVRRILSTSHHEDAPTNPEYSSQSTQSWVRSSRFLSEGWGGWVRSSRFGVGDRARLGSFRVFRILPRFRMAQTTLYLILCHPNANDTSRHP